jgi:hypothetical protein
MGQQRAKPMRMRLGAFLPLVRPRKLAAWEFQVFRWLVHEMLQVVHIMYINYTDIASTVTSL